MTDWNKTGHVDSDFLPACCCDGHDQGPAINGTPNTKRARIP